MPGSRKGLFIALALIAGGVLVFFLGLAALGVDSDTHPLGLLDWIIGGALIAPGFAYLIRWRQARDAGRAARAREN